MRKRPLPLLSHLEFAVLSAIRDGHEFAVQIKEHLQTVHGKKFSFGPPFYRVMNGLRAKKCIMHCKEALPTYKDRRLHSKYAVTKTGKREMLKSMLYYFPETGKTEL